MYELCCCCLLSIYKIDSFDFMLLKWQYIPFIAELQQPQGLPSGAPYSYRKVKETHELISHG